jgi:hypothetical protein
MALPEAPLRNRSHAMKKFILGVALAAATALAWALPSLADVEAQVQQGNYAQAESMMREVVAAKPNSARAHYVYGEILAHDGKFAAAAGEAGSRASSIRTSSSPAPKSSPHSRPRCSASRPRRRGRGSRRRRPRATRPTPPRRWRRQRRKLRPVSRAGSGSVAWS